MRLRTSIGLVGLPNVGKSTLFNALTRSDKAFVANYPFATINPNVAVVEVPDARLERLAREANSKLIKRDTIQIYDIAGLIKNASKGEGLGNEFLATIRGVDAVMHVVRCYEDSSVIHVESETRDPIKDIEVIEMELLLSDVDLVERRLSKLSTNKKTLATPRGKSALERVSRIRDDLLANGGKKNEERRGGGQQLKEMDEEEEEIVALRRELIVSKPSLYALLSDAGGEGDATTRRVEHWLQSTKGKESVVVNGLLESQLRKDGDEEMMREFGLTEENSTLSRLASAVARALGRKTFYTIGPQEARSWAISHDETAVQAASRIHTDIAKHFLMAEVRRELSDSPRMEGRDYRVQDGDVIHFRHAG